MVSDQLHCDPVGSPRPKVLVINTYGGSLLLGAQAAGMEIVASLEDAGYGSDLQQINFPEVQCIRSRDEWPNVIQGVSWSDLVVIGHPPCAAFSNQNNKKSLRGTTTDAFRCHTDLINYALGNMCRSLAIESVLGAYEAASETYENLSREHGYKVNYLMLNAVSFGVPQWRPRIWIIFHQLAEDQAFRINFQPRYRLLGDILDPAGTEWDLKGNPRDVWDRVKPEVNPDWPEGPIARTLEKVHQIPREPNFKGARDRFGIRGFTASHVWFVRPDNFTPVILFDRTLAVGQRLLTIEEYCSIMGFPRHYRWGRRERQFRAYLSKGVCPPIATWILQTMDRNNRGWEGSFTHEEEDFGGVIDLQPKKAEALATARASRQMEIPCPAE